jgi:hypothetical protein
MRLSFFLDDLIARFRPAVLQWNYAIIYAGNNNPVKFKTFNSVHSCKPDTRLLSILSFTATDEIGISTFVIQSGFIYSGKDVIACGWMTRSHSSL